MVRDVCFSAREKQVNQRLGACVSRVSRVTGGGVVLASAWRSNR